MVDKWDMQLGERNLSFETGKYAKQANGSVLVRYEDTVVLVTATMSEPRAGIDYLPLMVNYEERIYSIGKIPGSINRREGRPRDSATHNARLIDRPLRPLFPQEMRHDIQVIATILSVNHDHEPDIAALNGASAALSISDIPFEGPIGGVKIGMLEGGDLIINPDEKQREESSLDLTVAGTEDAVLMVEASGDEVPEEIILEGIEKAHREIKKIAAFQKDMVKEVGKEKFEFTPEPIPEDLEKQVRDFAAEDFRKAIQIEKKLARSEAVDRVKEETKEHFLQDIPEEKEKKREELSDRISKILDKIEKEEVRSLIIEQGIRPDGRKPEEIRPIWCEVQTLPRAHGSAVFTRGETQAMSVVTLGASSDEKTLFGLGEDRTKRYMHHYNFPPYSVGETNPLHSPGRREIGHGLLGESALRPMIPDTEEFPYTVRVVSEILESNGSSSQASICGSSLALMDAGVPIKKPVSGIAMGLIKEDDRVAVLSDIQGMEDHHGDMDFKVAGTRDGITALQMDIKIGGISKEIMSRALEKARAGRLHIMDKMQEVIPEPRAELSPNAPSMITMKIDPEKIRLVIGPGGKVINNIIDETGVEIDIEDDGTVYILADDQESGEEARKMVENLTKEAVVGEIYEGTVKNIMDFGAFVEILPGKEGLVHVSEISDDYVKEVSDVLSEGDKIQVKLTEIDDQNRLNLSRKEALKELEKEDKKDKSK